MQDFPTAICSMSIRTMFDFVNHCRLRTRPRTMVDFFALSEKEEETQDKRRKERSKMKRENKISRYRERKMCSFPDFSSMNFHTTIMHNSY